MSEPVNEARLIARAGGRGDTAIVPLRAPDVRLICAAAAGVDGPSGASPRH